MSEVRRVAVIAVLLLAGCRGESEPVSALPDNPEWAMKACIIEGWPYDTDRCWDMCREYGTASPEFEVCHKTGWQTMIDGVVASQLANLREAP